MKTLLYYSITTIALILTWENRCCNALSTVSEKAPVLSEFVTYNEGKVDPVLNYIENTQESLGRPYGDFLDAGTGIYSLRWIASLLHRHSNPGDKLHMSSFVAVTADENFRRDCQAKAEEWGVNDLGEVCVGNWAAGYNDNNIEHNGEETLCKSKMFDTILCDYLVGAVDYFAPFFQDQLFLRLDKHLKPGGVMYLTGLNPIPEKADGAADIFCRVTKLRDACILLARARPYREFPTDWVVRTLKQTGLKVTKVQTFKNTYDYAKISRQLNAARSTLPFIKNDDLRNTMIKQIDDLDEECKTVLEICPGGSFELGFDWVITAVKE